MRRTVAKVDLPYVQAFKDRHGKVRHYYRRKDFARTPLPGPPGSPEFMAAYAECVRLAEPQAPAAPRLQPRSLNALIIEYYRSDTFRALKPSTQRAYRSNLEWFRRAHGSKNVAGVQPQHINAVIHGMADRASAARNFRKRLFAAFALAVELGWRRDNPVRDTRPPKARTGGHAPWSDEDIAAYEKRWPSGSRERLALALLIYTGQRKSDVITMGRQHVAGDKIRVSQVKTGTRVAIRIHPKLKVELDATPKGLTFLTTEYGAPFTVAGFGNWFRDKARAAGLEKRTAHGLRKAAGRRLAEAGCTSKEIAAVLGHTDLAMVELYTRDADQEALADTAMSKLENMA